MGVELHITGTREVDELLATEPLALLIGMLLDQQIAIELAFTGPWRLRERIGQLDAAAIAAMDPDELERIFRERPALHRYPAAMAKRTQALCAHLVDEHDGDVTRLWIDVGDGAVLLRRIRALPGFGPEKAKIFTALLAKRFEIRPEGWERAAAPFSDHQLRSVADLTAPGDLDRLREHRRAQKAKGTDKQDRPLPP
ncbi:MAG: HhH-GPD-type base excision DNA repair protein [Actinomycetota bacterium]